MGVRTSAERRLDAHGALVLAIREQTPALSRALDWLEVTDPLLDHDDAALATHYAEDVLRVHAQEDSGEIPDDVYRQAEVEGALDHDWAAEDLSEQISIDMIRGGGA